MQTENLRGAEVKFGDFTVNTDPETEEAVVGFFYIKTEFFDFSRNETDMPAPNSTMKQARLTLPPWLDPG
ncbi:MAG: hypothetical protein KAG89_18660 [Fulvimarina manganoxydans]|uniref:hypothetical protein n=1 Tax=Fulvimarina manganoxydans TaxID=937218 RepID=UPI0023527D47|nr:hypothetical protein [Fulvimarina manganoxydans]MCK5934183.1 hypothetical protein [Fulvimarina manganoxydans]